MNESIKKSYIEAAIKDLKFEKLTDIQEKTIFEFNKNKNIIGKSKTGSGKTHAFLIPAFELLEENMRETQILILTPTKELALQIEQKAKHLASFSKDKISIRAFTGKTDRNRDLEILEKENPQILIMTPGKAIDYCFKASVLNISTSKLVVLDEVDMILELGFFDEIRRIFENIKDYRVMIFSATLQENIRAKIKELCKNKEFVYIDCNDHTELKISHQFIKIKETRNKMEELDKLMQIINPYLCLVFANTKKRVEEVYAVLREKNYNVGILHGDLEGRNRKKVLKETDQLKYQYLVCSDIVARGIDIEGISHVINYDLPRDMEFYLHRSGRTGRANFDGICYSLFDFDATEYLKFLERRKIKIEFKEMKNGEIIDYRNLLSRSNRVKPLTEGEKFAHKVIKKKPKVTPGYKKKRMVEVKKMAKDIDQKNYRRGKRNA